MIRSFHTRDLLLLNRLSGRSVPLNTSTVLLEQSNPLQGALMHQLLRRNYPTYVWRPRARDAEAFVQYRVSEGGTVGQLLWIGSDLPSKRQQAADSNVHDDVWMGLLERLTIVMGDAGVQSMVAEVPEDSDVFRVLKQAGFAAYTRQDVWKLTHLRGPGNVNVVQAMRPTAEWDVEVMYSHVVPNMIRMVESRPPLANDGWVRYESGDPVAYAHVKQSKHGMLLWLMVRLTAEIDPVSLIRGIVARKQPTPELPLYCVIRNYQDWLNRPLEQSGFQHIGSQVVMVKHTVQKVKSGVTSLEEVLAKQGAKARTSPSQWHGSDVQSTMTQSPKKEF